MKGQGGDGLLQAKERGLEEIFPPLPSEDMPYLDLGLVASRTVRKISFCCVSHPPLVCYGSPRK